MKYLSYLSVWRRKAGAKPSDTTIVKSLCFICGGGASLCHRQCYYCQLPWLEQRAVSRYQYKFGRRSDTVGRVA